MVAVDDGDRVCLIVVPMCERMVSIDVASLTCHITGCMLVWLVRWHGHIVAVVVGDSGGRWQLLVMVVTWWWWWFVVDNGGG